jgi:hypothetical protein
MWPYNRCVVRRSWALSQQDPNTLSDRSLDRSGGKEPKHGDEFTYEESLETGSKWTAILGSLAVMLFGVLFFGSSIVSRSRKKNRREGVMALMLDSSHSVVAFAGCRRGRFDGEAAKGIMVGHQRLADDRTRSQGHHDRQSQGRSRIHFDLPYVSL